MLNKQSTREIRGLNQSIAIPVLGLGVYQSQPGKETYRAVRKALELGYRHIDTAALYNNEKDVGKAIRDSGIPREHIFVTTKLWNSDHGPLARKAFEKSLRNLKLDYVDLYLIHWPVPDLRLQSWETLVALQAEGKSHAIGVSNYALQHLQELLSRSNHVPAVNQVELSPFLNHVDLRRFCRERQIQIQAYSPLTRGTRLQDPRLQKVAARHHKSAAQVLIRWSLEQELICLPKSVHPERLSQNLNVFDFALSPEDYVLLDGLNEDLHTCWDPTHAP